MHHRSLSLSIFPRIIHCFFHSYFYLLFVKHAYDAEPEKFALLVSQIALPENRLLFMHMSMILDYLGSVYVAWCRGDQGCGKGGIRCCRGDEWEVTAS